MSAEPEKTDQPAQAASGPPGWQPAPSEDELARQLEEWALAQEKAWLEAEARAAAEEAVPPSAATPAPAESAPARASTPAPEPAKRRWPMLSAAAGLLVAGFVAGSLWSRFIANPPRIVDASPTNKVELSPTEKVDARAVDDLILEGGYRSALSVLQRLAPNVRQAEPRLRYRAALCLEALGERTEAAWLYRSLILGGPPNCAETAARLGLARLALYDGKVVEARPILCEFLLSAAEPIYREHPYLPDAGILLAFTLLEDPSVKTLPGPLDVTIAAGAERSWPVERYLKWDTATRRSSDQKNAPDEGLTITRETDVLTRRVRAFLPQTAVATLLERLAQDNGLRILWTAAAREAVAGRTARLAVESAALSEVLRCLTLPHAMGWHISQGTLALFVPAPTTAAGKEAQIREARRALSEALAAAGDHPLGEYLMLELGNVEARSSNLVEAASWYDRLIRRHPRSRTVIPAAYNHGLLSYRLGNRDQAREAFYRAIDQTTGHGLTPLCHWWIGRTHLEDFDLDAAERAFRRAAATAEPGSPVVAAAALGQAAARLLAGNAHAAHEALQAQTSAIIQKPFQPTAVFLDAYCRHQIAQRSEASADLLRALSGLKTDPVLGLTGLFLRGQAYSRLDLSEQMRSLYSSATRTARGPLADEMTGFLAEQLLAEGKSEAAHARYTVLAAHAGRWTTRAQLRLAELQLRDGRSEECIVLCRKMLQAKLADRGEVLSLMGKAYQAKGDYRRAARCFAGEDQE